MGELQSNDIVNLRDLDDGRKRKRAEARIQQRSPTTSETKCIDNSNLQNRTGLEDSCASYTQRLEEKSEAESLDTTYSLPDSSDADFSDAETLVSRHHAGLNDAESSKFKTWFRVDRVKI